MKKRTTFLYFSLVFFLCSATFLAAARMQVGLLRPFPQGTSPTLPLAAERGVIELIPLGKTVSININTDGLIVLATGDVITRDGDVARPAFELLNPGDVIMKVDGVEVDKSITFAAKIENLPLDTPAVLTIRRNGDVKEISVTPAKAENGVNKLGVWVRDSARGIGTITFVNPETMQFSALGHGIIDVDTKQLLPIKDGRLLTVGIVDIKKGRSGIPGELVGEADRQNIVGTITKNTEVGLFGQFNSSTAPNCATQLDLQKMKIATKHQITEGPAQIMSDAAGGGVEKYDIFIERVNRGVTDNSKGMVIRVTDKNLLTRTNGIVQGMSGSPIIQNGKLAGAVTHVFLHNPQRGYGIFIENIVNN